MTSLPGLRLTPAAGAAREPAQAQAPARRSDANAGFSAWMDRALAGTGLDADDERGSALAGESVQGLQRQSSGSSECPDAALAAAAAALIVLPPTDTPREITTRQTSAETAQPDPSAQSPALPILAAAASSRGESGTAPGPADSLAAQLTPISAQCAADPATSAGGRPSPGPTPAQSGAEASLAGDSLSTGELTESTSTKQRPERPGDSASGASAADANADGGPTLRGIAAAKHHGDMRKAADMQQFTGLKEQLLPATAPASPTEAIPATQGKSSNPSARSEFVESSVAVAGAMRSSSLAELPDSEPIVSAQRTSGAARSLERTHDLVSLHALRLRDSSADSLRVMIRPGPGMQLSLDLHLRAGGGVEVSARLNRGDYEFLNSHWTELQHQLESRGVRLSALAHSEPSEDSSPGFGHPRRRQEPDEAPANEALIGLPFVNAPPVAQPELAPRPTTRGWNYWA